MVPSSPEDPIAVEEEVGVGEILLATVLTTLKAQRMAVARSR